MINSDAQSTIRIPYSITYYRQGESNEWYATTKRDDLIQGASAKGAVAYSTGLWEGQTQDDVSFATVSVFLEVDPRLGQERVFVHPSVWVALAKQARTLADEMFTSRHPNARIEHREEV